MKIKLMIIFLKKLVGGNPLFYDFKGGIIF